MFAWWQAIPADAASIKRLVDAVELEEIRTTIFDLQENVELDPPHTPYRSRFTLRVKNTNNPSDEALDNAAEYLFRKFESYGLEVEYDLFTISTENDPWGYVKAYGEGGTYEAKNVVATLPGTGPNKDSVYIICAHYDSVGTNESGWFDNWKTMAAPGANDNASGVSGVVEAARVLSKAGFDCTIKFIALAGHELGFFGSKHYAETAKGKEAIAGVLNLDGIGYETDDMDISVIGSETYGKEQSEWLVKVVYAAGRNYGINLILDDNPVFGGDQYSFWDAGFEAIMLSYPGKDSFDLSEAIKDWGYHTPGDTIDNLNLEFISRITQLTVATAAELANPLTIEGVIAVKPYGKLAARWGKIKVDH